MLSVFIVLVVAALICSILHLMGRCPIGVPVLLLAIWACLTQIPLGR